MPLTIYKSSAGSGKTTTLVTEYLKIALVNPNSFRNILAITFTNKAANEMKQRVISTLKQLSNVNEEPSANLSGLINSLNFDKVTLSNKSQTLLSLILHNYDEFAISTIDSFIHRIIRTFATDVQLPQNFEVVIDNDDIIPDIIHNLYEKVGSDKELTKVLINFVLSEADEENSYDPTSKLIDFIKYQMKEDGFEHISKLDNLSIAQLGDIIIRINKKIASEKSMIIHKATACVELCNSNGIEIGDFFQGKNGFLGYFTKLMKFNVADDKLFPSKYVQKTIDEDKWYGSKATFTAREAITQLTPELTEYYNDIIKLVSSYFYFRLLYSKIYSLALVHEIRNLFVEFTEQTGKVHISEFNKKISTEIANQPVPFIYERLGRKYRYFLIDEFQDTSVLQWYNLLPLIEESLSYGNFNMLVGDAKQAIYRFRSGEVELFSSLPDLYNNDGSQLSLSRQNLLHRECKEEFLSVNWRSYPEIIKFNNNFFETIIEPLSERTKIIYDNHKQIIPNNGKTGGLVSLNFVNEDDAEEYNIQKLDKIKGFVEQLINNKYREKDICILCRTKDNIIDIAAFLIENGFNVVSSESLLLTNSLQVRLIIAFNKLLLYPDNELALIEFVDVYLKLKPSNNSVDEAFRLLRKKKVKGVEAIFDYFNIEASKSNISTLSTYEIAEFVVRDIIQQKNANIFVQYLLDYIFETKLPLDLFIDKWEDKKNSLFITVPNDVDAIQIMTIHKAKGLDFQAVIVDAAMLRQQKTKTEYWEDINLPDFKELKVGLFPISKKLEHINRLSIYDEEATKAELDFLNVIYVATTRPVKALFTVSQVKSRHPKDKFTNYLVSYLSNIGLWDDSEMLYNFGELPTQLVEKQESNDEIVNLDEFVSSNWQKLISVALSDNLNREALSSISSQTYGKLIHKVLSEIRFKNDVQKIIKSLSLSGLLSDTDIKIIEQTLISIVSHPDLQKYFQPNLIIKNESEVLLGDGEIIRPDRVVVENKLLTIIDYKTGAEKPEDYEQIMRYKHAFLNLGYNTIEAKLVYIGDAIRVVCM